MQNQLIHHYLKGTNLLLVQPLSTWNFEHNFRQWLAPCYTLCWELALTLLIVTISSFLFLPSLYFFISLTVWAPPDSSLLPSYCPLPSTNFSYLLIHCSTTFHHVLSIVVPISFTMFFFLLQCSLDYFMNPRPNYINPWSIPCIP